MLIDFDSVFKKMITTERISSVNIEGCNECINEFINTLLKYKRKKIYLEGSGLASIDLSKEKVDGCSNPDKLQLNEYIAEIGSYIEKAEKMLSYISSKYLNDDEIKFLQSILINKNSRNNYEVQNHVSHSTLSKISQSCVYKLSDGLGLMIEKNDNVVEKIQYMKSKYFGYGG